METYYVGSGGSGGNNGLTWATRKGSLNQVEDIPVAAGDTVYVGPGTYRETLTVDVSGTAGNPITYVADVTGQNTDGVGGIVRITGSDNDQTATRSNGITATSRNYRTFRGFSVDTTSGVGINLATAADNWIIEDCVIQATVGGITLSNPTNCTIRRCIFVSINTQCLSFTHSSTVSNSNNLVENCIFAGNNGANGINNGRIGGVTVKNCLFDRCSFGVRVTTALAASQVMTVTNSVIQGCGTGLAATTTAEFSEDYNTIFLTGTPRSSVAAGANSVAHAPLFEMPILQSGIRYPWAPFSLSQFSTLAAKTGSSPASLDLFGATRPATNSKNSWGAIQYQPFLRDTATTYNSSAASLRLSDAGQHQMFVPVSAEATTFRVRVMWEADYAGTKPQMIIRQPGQSDTTVTASGSSGSWELLSTTLTPAATPGYVVVIFVSNNTATSGSYSCYFDRFPVG